MVAAPLLVHPAVRLTASSGWQMKKKIAIHAEDYDIAKKLKLQIQRLEKSLEPPPPAFPAAPRRRSAARNRL